LIASCPALAPGGESAGEAYVGRTEANERRLRMKSM
jgi:hypothetical protein